VKRAASLREIQVSVAPRPSRSRSRADPANDWQLPIGFCEVPRRSLVVAVIETRIYNSINPEIPLDGGSHETMMLQGSSRCAEGRRGGFEHVRTERGCRRSSRNRRARGSRRLGAREGACFGPQGMFEEKWIEGPTNQDAAPGCVARASASSPILFPRKYDARAAYRIPASLWNETSRTQEPKGENNDQD